MSQTTRTLILLLFGLTMNYQCDLDSIFSKEKTADGNQVNSDSMTLASLQKVDDYPLYIMHYQGDYGFEDYQKHGELRQGSVPSNSSPSGTEWACTCFTGFGENSDPILGRNFDWQNRACLLLFTRPSYGYASVSMVDLAYFGYSMQNLPDDPQNRHRLLETPLLPFDGMNEMGVAVGMMAVPQAEPPYDAKKVTIGEIAVIRLVLDYAKDVAHAIQLIQKYNVRMEQPPIHYLIADRTGHSVIIEFVNRSMKIIPNREPFQVCTNFIITGSNAPEQTGCWRYNLAYQMLEKEQGVLTNETAQKLLQKVAQSNTMWSTVYNMEKGSIEVVLGRNYQQSHAFKLSINP